MNIRKTRLDPFYQGFSNAAALTVYHCNSDGTFHPSCAFPA
jgi:hypothetical protein